MIEIGVIWKSDSPWASAILLVRKKDGSLRFCVDLRKLNARTIKDACSLLWIEESMDCLSGAQIFTSLNLKSGYWQIKLSEKSIPLTTFMVGLLGFYECVHMLFGLTNTPVTSQQLMESCLGDMHLDWCIIYLDNITVFSKSPQEHIQRLRGVFEKLWAAGLKLKPSRFKFFWSQISYLGHIVSREGIKMDPNKVSVICDQLQPWMVTEVCSFLGYMNYYRKFIHRYV